MDQYKAFYKLERIILKEELVALTGHSYTALILEFLMKKCSQKEDFRDYLLEERKRVAEGNLESAENLLFGWLDQTVMVKQLGGLLKLDDGLLNKYTELLYKNCWLQERNSQSLKGDSYTSAAQWRVDLVRILKNLLSMGYILQDYHIDNSILALLLKSNAPGLEKNAHCLDKRQNEQGNKLDTSPVSALAVPSISEEGHIREIFKIMGFKNRLTDTFYNQFYRKWTEGWGLSKELITRAAQETFASTNAPTPKYLDKVLSSWHQKGIFTLGEYNASLEQLQKVPNLRTANGGGKKARKHMDGSHVNWDDDPGGM